MQDNISSDTVAQDKTTSEANQTTEVPLSTDIAVLDTSESPNVSGSSDMISGTPPKPSSRRQSFITLEKYGEGRPASPLSVKKFTGPLTRTSCSQESPKSQNDSKLPSLVSYSQPENGKQVSKESTTITQDSTNQADEQNMEITAELKPVAKCPGEGTEDDVIPDTQTQELNEAVEVVKTSSDKSSVEVNTEIASPDGESEVFAASQDSSQVELRRSGRRRSRPVLPGEESDQESKSKQQKKAPINASTSNDAQKSTPAKKTDILSTRTRRSRVHEDPMNESGKLHYSKHKDEQKDSQVPSLATSVSSSQGRSSRSKEVNQTESSFEKQSPLCQGDDKRESLINQSDSQSPSRPVRRTRVTNANVEVSDKKQRVENSQGGTPAGVSKQVDSSASDTDSQSPGRPRRSRRSEAAEAQNKDKPGLRNEQVSDPGHAQTPTLSKGKLGRRKRAEEEMSNISKGTTLSRSVNSECSQGNENSELQDSSQGRGKYRTRRSSQALLASVENSESDTRDGQRPKRARGHKSSEVMPSTVINESAPGDLLTKKDADIPSVPMDVSKNEPEACLGVDTLNEVQDFHKADDKDEAPAAEGQAIECDTSGVMSDDDKQQSDKVSKLETDSDKEQSVNTVLEERAVEKETLPSSQYSLELPAKGESKALELRTCPHSKRGRGRRRSTNCNCFQVSSTPSKEQCISSQLLQDLKENQVLLESSSPPSEAELNSITSVLPEKEIVAHQENCPDIVNVQSSSLPSLTEAEVPAESPVEKYNESVSQSSEVNEGTTQADEHHVDDTDGKHEEKEQDEISSEKTFNQEQPQEGPSAPDASSSHSQPVEYKPVCQEESKSPVSQEEMVHSVEKDEMPEKEELVPELDGGVTSLPEGTELDRTPHEEGGDGEATQIEKDLQPETALPCEATVPPQTASAEACLDSPPKQTPSDVLCRNTDVRQSPSNSVSRGVWSPSASPSTSILKKGQKRQCEEDSPSPLIKVVF